jgi:hypothetical protein
MESDIDSAVVIDTKAHKTQRAKVKKAVDELNVLRKAMNK